jgi:trans-aconitate methyltransferase
MTDYDTTIDWDRYWSEADEEDRADANPTAKLAVDPLLSFFEETHPPESYADVGCGPGGAVFAVAEAYPESTVM